MPGGKWYNKKQPKAKQEHQLFLKYSNIIRKQIQRLNTINYREKFGE